MKKFSERIQHIGDMIKDKKQQVPDLSTKEIRSVESECTDVSQANFIPENKIMENNLPVSKKTQVPAPNVVLRSSLFGVVKRGNRSFEKNVLKASFNGYTVLFSGEQLDQSDLDVWLECLHRCQSTPLGHTVRFKPNDFLKSINRKNGKSDYLWLNESLWRLRVNDIVISDGKYTYSGSLIFNQYRNEETGESCLVLNPEIAICFGDTAWTGIAKSIRLQLKGKPLTQWLYGFYSSHYKPLPIKVITLKELCGSEVKELRKFRQMLKKSLSELSTVTGWCCEIDSKDKVIIKKVVKKN
ncbi:plasmid replication initiator TrfA [Arsenophonus sp.]|uniref:plasmid replication initiator TrfA n=1 Tax=Arsenophonus sp. TaxID=1872640 RepID=UPI00387A0209